MTKKFLQEFFGLSDAEMGTILNNASKFIEKINEDDSDENDEPSSYFRSKCVRFEDGEVVEKFDKECVNGKCVKDEHFCNNKVCKSKKDLRDARYYNLECENEKLFKDNENLRSQIKEMTEYIDGLNDKIKKIELEKVNLQKIIESIKNCF